MNRRDFINKTTLIGTSASLFGGISQFALAQKSHQIQSIKQTGPLIIVFLRGGADGLGILSPLEDSNFISARSPQLLLHQLKIQFLLPAQNYFGIHKQVHFQS